MTTTRLRGASPPGRAAWAIGSGGPSGGEVICHGESDPPAGK
ncbi:hypothetical protein ACIHCQ_34125 [Streptomyces sp. NPDC052236]